MDDRHDGRKVMLDRLDCSCCLFCCRVVGCAVLILGYPDLEQYVFAPKQSTASTLTFTRVVDAAKARAAPKAKTPTKAEATPNVAKRKAKR
jgi:hypothetical protein